MPLLQSRSCFSNMFTLRSALTIVISLTQASDQPIRLWADIPWELWHNDDDEQHEKKEQHQQQRDDDPRH